MILIINNFTFKWLNDEIKDCGNNFIDNNLELSINDEKLKDNHNNIINPDNLYNEPTTDRNNEPITGNREEENSTNNIRSGFNRNKNKNNRVTNSKETNKHINLQRINNTNNNKKKMYKLPSSCRVSESKGRNILLDSCPKPLKNYE
jgi:hypothetical protein